MTVRDLYKLSVCVGEISGWKLIFSGITKEMHSLHRPIQRQSIHDATAMLEEAAGLMRRAYSTLQEGVIPIDDGDEGDGVELIIEAPLQPER